MLTIERVEDILKKYSRYFSRADAVSLFQLKDTSIRSTTNYFTKISGDIFTLRNLPPAKFEEEHFNAISSDLLYAYGVDFYPEAYFASVLPGIIGKNETLLYWVRSKYEKRGDLGLYTVKFRDPLKVPLEVRNFILKAFVVIHAINNETNKGNVNLVKQLLKRGD